MSLVRGGRFDINGDYTSPHAEHQTGQNADIKTTQVSNGDCAAGIPWQQPQVRGWLSLNLSGIFGNSDHCIEFVGNQGGGVEHLHVRAIQRSRTSTCGVYGVRP